MKKIAVFISVLLLMLFLSFTAQAALIERNLILDVNSFENDGSNRLSFSNIAIDEFTFKVGDLLQLNVQFLPDQAIEWTDYNGDSPLEQISFHFCNTNVYYPPGLHLGQAVTSTELNFINPMGDLLTNPVSHSGGAFDPAGGGIWGNLTSSSFSFTGFEIVTELLYFSVNPDPGATAKYMSLYLNSTSDPEDSIYGISGSVPEPATLLLFGSGLVSLAAIWRRKLRK